MHAWTGHEFLLLCLLCLLLRRRSELYKILQTADCPFSTDLYILNGKNINLATFVCIITYDSFEIIPLYAWDIRYNTHKNYWNTLNSDKFVKFMNYKKVSRELNEPLLKWNWLKQWIVVNLIYLLFSFLINWWWRHSLIQFLFPVCLADELIHLGFISLCEFRNREILENCDWLSGNSCDLHKCVLPQISLLIEFWQVIN